MRRVLITIILGAAFATAGWAQESAEDADAADTADTEVETETEPVDDSELDDQTYQGSDDDDFRPTEEIPADQSIPFPTDI